MAMAALIRPVSLRPPLAPPPGIPVSSLKMSAATTGDDLPPNWPERRPRYHFVELRLKIPGPVCSHNRIGWRERGCNADLEWTAVVLQLVSATL
jgi:hypothetical protein